MRLTRDTTSKWDQSKDPLQRDLIKIQNAIDNLQAQVDALGTRTDTLDAAVATPPTIIGVNGRPTNNGSGIFVLPGCGLDGDGRIGSPLTTVLDEISMRVRNNKLRAPICRGRWWIMDGPNLYNMGLTGAAVVSSGAAATNSYADKTLYAHTSTGASGAGGAGVSNATQLIQLKTVDPIGVYHFKFGSDISSIRLRMGFHNGTIGDSATQPAPGAGLRYMAVDGAQWRLEQYDNVTRTTSALFGTVTASHEYRCTVRVVTDASGNPLLFGIVEDLTNGEVYSSTLAVATGTLSFTTQMGQIRMFSTAASTRLLDLCSFELFFPSD